MFDGGLIDAQHEYICASWCYASGDASLIIRTILIISGQSNDIIKTEQTDENDFNFELVLLVNSILVG